jgi:hypothetical protein
VVYLAFGAAISGNVELGPLPVATQLHPAVVLRHRRVTDLGESQGAGTSYASQGRRIRSSLRKSAIRIRIEDSMQFSLLLRRGLVLCTATAAASVEQIRYWFLQKILPAYLLLSGQVEILHAGAVEIRGQGAAFLAASGTGKSTLVHHFLSQGHTLLADEHLLIANESNGLDRSNMVLPTVPYLRPYRRLECLGDYTERFCTRAYPLHRLYLLEAALPEDPVSIEQLRGNAAGIAVCMRQQFDIGKLAASAVLHRLPLDRFARVARLAAEIPVKRIRVPRDLSRLPEVHDAILQDMSVEMPVGAR